MAADLSAPKNTPMFVSTWRNASADWRHSAVRRPKAPPTWDGGKTVHDEIIVFEVMAETLDASWWKSYRLQLEREFRQDEIVVRAWSDTLLWRRPSTKDIDQLFEDLAKSPFRRRFRLRPQELRYLERKGLRAVLADADDLLVKRLGAASPQNDGKQTPFKGHPVFVAQHATATCCRGCLAKWHGIRKGEALRPAELEHIAAVIERWMRRQSAGIPEEPAQGRLLWSALMD
jgi:hypothetical protein